MSSPVQTYILSPCTSLHSSTHDLLSFDTRCAHVLDTGSGAGKLTILISTQHAVLPITAADIAPDMIEGLDQTITDRKYNGIVTHVLS